MRFRVGCLLLLFLSGSGLGSARAEPAVEPDAAATAPASERRVRVLILSHANVDWAARVRGQLDDVDASVSVSAAPPPKGSREAQVETARRLAAEHDADVVAWIAFDLKPSEGTVSEERAPGAYVIVWSAPTEQQYARRLGEPWHQLSPADQSAALEIGALTVRSAVRSLAIDRANEPPSEATVAPGPVEVTPTVTSEPSPSWGWHAGASYGWQLDGQTPWGMSTLAARVGLHREAWSGSLQGGWGLPASIDVPGAELELQRHVAWLEGAYAPVSLAVFSLEALGRMGATFSRRETRPTSADVLATEPRTELSFSVAAGVRGALHVSGSQSLTLGVAATWLLEAPRYVIEDPTNDRRFEYSLWNIQPSIELGWVFSR